jgi:hypothetical protein
MASSFIYTLIDSLTLSTLLMVYLPCTVRTAHTQWLAQQALELLFGALIAFTRSSFQTFSVSDSNLTAMVVD